MTMEVHKLLQEAISVVPTSCTKGLLSRIFLVPKKDGSQRPVINLPAEPICSMGAFQDGEHPLSGEHNY